MNQQTVKAILDQLDRELWIVTAQANSERGGLVATFVSSASIVAAEPRMLVGLSKQHHTWKLIEQSQHFALHLLKPSQLDWIWRFGLQSGSLVEKFDGLNVETSPQGTPLLTDALCCLECRMETAWDTGDRMVILAEVLEGSLLSEEKPLRTSAMMAAAPVEKLKELKTQREQDEKIDAVAIRKWRDHHP